ncbi:MAG TPA: bifunctional 5,10-methylenetetrahydrofolate dehydrogenase/5,10-methenyltetrahydrofolate cyclohydrolase [Candidatus Paceibacterota bacterium]
MADILDGKIARDSYTKGLIERSKRLFARPTLALIQIGDNKESAIYIEQKKRFARTIDARVEHIQFKSEAKISDVEMAIRSLNARADIHGIIIQLPLPAGFDKHSLIEMIDPAKDVDGLTDANQRLLEAGTPNLVPATAKGVMSLLDFYGIEIKGKKAVVFGRSRLVGGPIASLLSARGASVSVCNSQTADPRAVSTQADIVVAAIGKPELIDASYVKAGSVIIDVGISTLPEGRKSSTGKAIAGDVNFAAVSPLVKAISPVPGGVGPMTVLSLFDNLIVSAERSAAK